MAKTVTFGEIMLRLKSPEHERLFQSPVLEQHSVAEKQMLQYHCRCLEKMPLL